MIHPKILVIEDNAVDIELLRMALDSQGEQYELEVLRSGEEALRFVLEHRKGIRAPDPCVILLDIYLPRCDGMEVLKALRAEPALTHIRVVVWSSFVPSQKAGEVEKFGAIYRTKPLTLDEFLALGKEILEICKEEIARPLLEPA